jgi:hypothetical protein
MAGNDNIVPVLSLKRSDFLKKLADLSSARREKIIRFDESRETVRLPCKGDISGVTCNHSVTCTTILQIVIFPPIIISATEDGLLEDNAKLKAENEGLRSELERVNNLVKQLHPRRLLSILYTSLSQLDSIESVLGAIL